MDVTGIESLRQRIIDEIAARAQAEYVREFHEGPMPTNPERINAAGEPVNFKLTKDESWIAQQRALGNIVTGQDVLAKPKGGIVEIDGQVFVDIASRLYDDLPSDLQALNQASATVAADQLILAAKEIHDAWVVNNAWQVADVSGNDRIYSLKTADQIYAFVLALPDEQRLALPLFVPFDELTPQEQNKDLVFIVEAAAVIDPDPSRTIPDEAIDSVAKAIEIASQVHDQWVMANLERIANITGDGAPLELEDVTSVYQFISGQSAYLKQRLQEFMPFSELPPESQRKSLMFVTEGSKAIDLNAIDAALSVKAVESPYGR